MTDKTTIVAARIPVETKEQLEKRLKKDGKGLREVITEYAEGTKVRIPKILVEIDSLASYFNMTGEELLKDIKKGLEVGRLGIEDGKIVGADPSK